jgi:hypothetical protein
MSLFNSTLILVDVYDVSENFSLIFFSISIFTGSLDKSTNCISSFFNSFLVTSFIDINKAFFFVVSNQKNRKHRINRKEK